jgi:hypothetical protein
MPSTTGTGRRWRAKRISKQRPTDPAQKCRRKFLRYFPDGFADETYIDWERDYKWQAHKRWVETINRDEHLKLVKQGRSVEFARHAIAIESRTNLLFSFEKMALRDAVRTPESAEAFARGLYAWIYQGADDAMAFEEWCAVVESLPRKQTRVLTWPVVTVFGFIARPDKHMFVKPMVTKRAATKYGYEFDYASRPNWGTYASALGFAERVRRDVSDLEPRDLIDLQSFIWVMGSDEYP